MADDEDSGNHPAPHRPWDVVVSTVGMELLGLAFAGVVTLVTWPFGWLPDPGLVFMMAAMFAVWPAAEAYRAGPRRRSAVVVALLALVTTTLLGAAAVNWAFPPPVDADVGILVGSLVAVPVGAAVLAWSLDRGTATGPGSEA
ncbi:hypothetical protein [Streptomyces sp. NPDC050263]|uniref:hypothetical protein n=1 Tax=Streptomyces sp. NPDC050263 TaxID=3155037 RepID=UPI003449F832